MPGVIKTSAGGILDVFTQRQYFNGPIWFLLSLFNVSLLMFLISSTSQREWGRCLYVCLFGLFGYFLDQADVMFPLMIDTSFTMLPFFYVGVLVKRYSLHKYLRGGVFTLRHMVNFICGRNCRHDNIRLSRASCPRQSLHRECFC